jgi:ABC-type multidrug transport system ATPase subunit
VARVAGFDCAREADRVRAHVGLLAHGAWVYEDLTASENLRFWTTLGGHPATPDEIRAALAAVDLERLAGRRVRTFSLGMRRRLSLARLVLAAPRVLLLDEPYAGLDARAGKWLDGHLTAVKAAGGAIVMTTHSFGRGLGVADRVAILAGGRVAHEAAVAALGPDDIRRLYELHSEDAS